MVLTDTWCLVDVILVGQLNDSERDTYPGSI